MHTNLSRNIFVFVYLSCLATSNCEHCILHILNSHSIYAHTDIQVNNVVWILTRIIPIIFEDPQWWGLFWTPLPLPVDDPAKSMVNL